MPVRKLITEKQGVYFITFTCTDWLLLFHRCGAYDTVYNWFDYLKKEKHFIIGYIIMPNHVHAVIAFRNTGKSINTIISNGKRFIAYELVKRLKENKDHFVLSQLTAGVNDTEKKEGKIHSVFETSFDWKECKTETFIEQKLNYIHLNACKANLAKLPEQYVHSSAQFYIEGSHGKYKITSFMELRDIDLTGEL